MTASPSEQQKIEQRQQAIKEWESQTSHSLLVDSRKKKISLLAFVILILILLGGVWLFKNSNNSQQAGVEKEETIAEREPVPKLKEPSAEATDQQQIKAEPLPSSTDDPQKAQLDAQRQEQERQLLEARKKSALMPTQSGHQISEPVEQKTSSNPPTTNNLSLSNHDSNTRFKNNFSDSIIAQSTANRIDHLEYKILQGKLIEAVLEPRAISDLPGTLCATVQRDVVGSQGRIALIPWGSRLCGIYNAELRKGQDRLFAIWHTVRRPDGVQITLDSIGADQLGSSGMGGEVDTHFAKIFGISAMLSVIGAGSANIGVSGTDTYNSATYYRQSVQQAAAQTSQQVLQPYINIPPTITVPAGSRIRIYVNRDLDFTSIYQDEISAAQRERENQEVVTVIH